MTVKLKNTPLKIKNIISTQDFSKEQINEIILSAEQINNSDTRSLLKNTIIASCFYEPSTRTRLSFESAALKMGGSVIGFSDSSTTSSQKGETLYDTMKIIGSYADLIVLRHPLEGAAQVAADASSKPIINAGDGSNQHPTQTLLDLFTIKECQGTLEDLSIAIAGDLKYGRTAHSLAQALSLFKPRLYLVSPSELEMPREICDRFKREGVKYSFHKDISEVLPKIDILYMTRVQKERFSHPMEYETVKKSCCLKLEDLNSVKENFRILHPLPRVHEIEKSIDQTPYAYYFKQAENGLLVRQTLLALLLDKMELI